MSKAFMKEDSDQDNSLDFEFDLDDQEFYLEGELSEENDRSGGVKNYITQAGFDRLKADLDHLLHTERPKLIAASSVQADIGLSFDDVEMKDAQRRLREVEREIRILQRRVDTAEVVQPEKQSGDRVLFGATVTVADEDEKTRVYQIVGASEADSKTGKISWRSPIGHALLQAKVGDAVTIRLPHGEEDLEVLKIEFKPIE